MPNDRCSFRSFRIYRRLSRSSMYSLRTGVFAVSPRGGFSPGSFSGMGFQPSAMAPALCAASSSSSWKRCVSTWATRCWKHQGNRIRLFPAALEGGRGHARGFHLHQRFRRLAKSSVRYASASAATRSDGGGSGIAGSGRPAFHRSTSCSTGACVACAAAVFPATDNSGWWSAATGRPAFRAPPGLDRVSQRALVHQQIARARESIRLQFP